MAEKLIQTILLFNLLMCVWTLPVNLTEKNKTDDHDTKLLEVSRGLFFADKILRLRFWKEHSNNPDKKLLYQVFGSIYQFIHYESSMQKEEIVNQVGSVSSGFKAVLTTMIEQACKWMKGIRPNDSFNCSKNEWKDLYMMQTAQVLSKTTYDTLEEYVKLKNVNYYEWFRINILCREDPISPDVLQYIATYYGQQIINTTCS